MINSNRPFFLQELNQQPILPFNSIRRCMYIFNNLLIRQSFQSIFIRNTLIKLIEYVFELFLYIVNHFVSLLDWSFTTLDGLFVEVLLFDDFLEHSFIVGELVVLVGGLVVFDARTELVELLLIFLHLTSGSEDFQAGLVLDLLLIEGEE